MLTPRALGAVSLWQSGLQASGIQWMLGLVCFAAMTAVFVGASIAGCASSEALRLARLRAGSAAFAAQCLCGLPELLLVAAATLAITLARRSLAACAVLCAAFIATDISPAQVISAHANPLLESSVLAMLQVTTGWLLGRGAMACITSERRLKVALLELRLQSTYQLTQGLVAERHRIGCYLHDQIRHSLAVLSLEVEHQRLDGATPAARTDAMRKQVLDIQGALDALMKNLPLNAAHFEHFIDSLPTLTRDPAITVQRSGNLPIMGFAKAREVDGFLTDAARELTTNCLRHSNCKSIVVSVCRGAEGISMEVIDDGRGADSLRFGHGLTEVAARAERYGGHLSVSSHPGRFKAALYLPFVLNTPKS